VGLPRILLLALSHKLGLQAPVPRLASGRAHTKNQPLVPGSVQGLRMALSSGKSETFRVTSVRR
jgi:hypothetical protein